MCCTPEDQADGPSPLSEACDSDRVDDLAAAGEVKERFQREGVGAHRIRRLRPFRMDDCGFQVIPPKNKSGVDREDFRTPGLCPIPDGTDDRLGILDCVVSRVKARTFFLLKIRASSAIE